MYNWSQVLKRGRIFNDNAVKWGRGARPLGLCKRCTKIHKRRVQSLGRDKQPAVFSEMSGENSRRRPNNSEVQSLALLIFPENLKHGNSVRRQEMRLVGEEHLSLFWSLVPSIHVG